MSLEQQKQAIRSDRRMPSTAESRFKHPTLWKYAGIPARWKREKQRLKEIISEKGGAASFNYCNKPD
jgi:hypothetical protein